METGMTAPSQKLTRTTYKAVSSAQTFIRNALALYFEVMTAVWTKLCPVDIHLTYIPLILYITVTVITTINSQLLSNKLYITFHF